LPSRFNVFVALFNSPGIAGSGICLTQTMTFMVDHCYRVVAPGPNREQVR
jgi:hypothetical protein